MRKIILTTGGTGGHIFPALAVAHELERLPGLDMLFVGSLYGPEKKLVEEAGLAFHGFPVRGFLGRGLRSLSACYHMVTSIFSAIALLRAYRPNVVAGFGGYAAFAPMLAASLLHIPCVIHEQNAVPGMSNRLLGRIARRICLSLPKTSFFKQEKCLVTGNPVRESVVYAGLAERTFHTRHLLVLGGSQGAHALNTFMMEHLPDFAKAGIDILHQTGEKDFAMVQDCYVEHGYPRDAVCSFISDMPKVYQWADLALCRSGASTIAELCACGLPSILVPFPYAIHDHQTKNAEVLVRANAARLVPEKAITTASVDLVQDICTLFDNPEERAMMSHSAKKIARPDAAAQVAQAIVQEAKESL